MKYFKLPDLGEGLQEAEIVEWKVVPGEQVEEDALMLLVETAKALVEVPCPQRGIIARLHGEPGDIVHIGEVLVEFAGQEDDGGTVVGSLPGADEIPPTSLDDAGISRADDAGREQTNMATKDWITPGVAAFARRTGLEELVPQLAAAEHGYVTQGHLVGAAEQLQTRSAAAKPRSSPASDSAQSAEDSSSPALRTSSATGKLRGARRAMALAMQGAGEVALVSVFDEADISDWAEPSSAANAACDPTTRLVMAIRAACAEVPVMNSWYDGKAVALQLCEEISVGIAVDTGSALLVPVLRKVTDLSADSIRNEIDRLAKLVRTGTAGPDVYAGATIGLSNFGSLEGHAGQFATPLVMPPQVCIVGAGAARLQVRAYHNQAALRKVLPISLSFDHRAVSGAEAARFLAVLTESLQAVK